jgi:transcriptional regulator with XRE-family HTH domain
MSVVTSEGVQRRVMRIRFGLQMRRLREAAGLQSKDAAKALRVNPSRLSRFERGAASLKAAEVDVLLKLYETPDEHAERLRALGDEARRRGFKLDVPDWAETYIALEAVADEIKIYNGELVPGLLQTEDYAHALIRTSPKTVPPGSVDDAVATRLGRQERMNDSSFKIWVMLGEAVLHRPVGGADVLREQLLHLHTLNKQENVCIQLIPYEAGGHAALGTSFAMFRMVDLAATFVYVEWLTDSVYIDQPEDIEVYGYVCNKLMASGTDKPTTQRMLTRRIRDLS